MNASDFGNDRGSQDKFQMISDMIIPKSEEEATKSKKLFSALFKPREINDQTSNNQAGLYSNKTILK
jgi:hypothetical protein